MISYLLQILVSLFVVVCAAHYARRSWDRAKQRGK